MKVTPLNINWYRDLSIFASQPFLKAVGDEYGWLGGIDNSGKLRCILPYTVIRKSFFRMIRFRIETIVLGKELDILEEKAFLNSAVDFFRSSGLGMIIPGSTNAIFRTYPNGADAVPYGTYIIDLTQSEDTLWSNLSASHRRKIRMARKNGITIKSGREQLKVVYRLIRDTFKRSAKSFMSFKDFELLVVGLGEYIKVFVADYRGAAQGCAVIPFSNHSAYYLYGGSASEPVTGANNLLHWEAIRKFKEFGAKRYDFGGVRINPKSGSKQEGLMIFKQRFGGELVKGYMWKLGIHRLQFAAYSIAVSLLRGGDIVDNERLKYRVSKVN